jgi:16S rRNA (uracil1498-N3)-methyltransferase
MNRILIFDQDPHQKEIIISDEETLRHCHDVLKINIHDTLQICFVNHCLATAKVMSCKKEIVLEIIKTQPGLRLPYYLEVAASRPPTMKKVIEHGTSLGVQNFKIFKGILSDKSYLQSRIYEEEQLQELLKNGLSQAKSLSHLPKVHRQERFSPSAHQQKFILSLTSEATFSQVDLDFEKPITLAIGPERGWTKDEEESLINQGYQAIKITQTTLRVEIAAYVALGQLELLRLKTSPCINKA